MSTTPGQAGGAPGMQQRRDSQGPPSAGINPQQHNMAPPPTAAASAPGTAQNLNQIVSEYLNRKGYNRTEAMLRIESSNVDAQGRPKIAREEDRGGHKYFTAYSLLLQWIEDNLEIYKPELRRLLWPVFVYSHLNLVAEYYPQFAQDFFDEYSRPFQNEHADDLRQLEFIRHPEHLDSNDLAKAYRNNRYRISLTQSAFYSLTSFLESKEREGGSVVQSILQNSMQIVSVDRATAGKDRAFAAMVARLHGDNDMPDEDEGIPGHNPGSANTDRNAPNVLPKLALGQPTMDSDMREDVQAELEEEDAKNPPGPGQRSYVEEFEHQIKREPSEDAPNRDNVPMPPPLARDVAMEVQKIKEVRDRFLIPPRTNGVGPGVSITMFTFHNTFDSVNCIDFSGDSRLVAVGTSESYIRVWSLEGKPLPSMMTNGDSSVQPSSSKRLIGHSGPVYAVSFSPSVANDHSATVKTNSRFLLSSSADKTVRLWSLDTWTCLVIYKAHDQPVWDVTWGPFGHYFVTGSHDRTARLWSTDNVAPLRMMVGHDQDVDCVSFHPNNAYVFTGSSDKTVRMWDLSRGSAVRIFTGHTANVTCVSCAPNGRTLASADDLGAIILWDLPSGRRIKRMRGHGKGGIWSLAWTVESSLLVSGGADQTVRVWDVLLQTEAAIGPGGPGKGGTDSTGAAKVDGNAASGGGMGKKGRGKDAPVTIDQVSAFPTKKSSVYKVVFTNMNLVLAGGAYMP